MPFFGYRHENDLSVYPIEGSAAITKCTRLPNIKPQIDDSRLPDWLSYPFQVASIQDMQNLLTLVVPSLVCLIPYAIFQYTRRPTRPYPPGPVPKPIIGNLLDMPFDKKPWLRYLEWSKRLHRALVHYVKILTP